ncbi:MAG: clostripain-related cysteine peptidase [Planctomycetota bacterium]
MRHDFTLPFLFAMLVFVAFPGNLVFSQAENTRPGPCDSQTPGGPFLDPASSAMQDRDRLGCWSTRTQPVFSDLIASMSEAGPGEDDTDLPPGPVLQNRAPAGKNWTFLFYDDADFYNGYDPLIDFSNEAYSGVNLNVIILQDSISDTAYLWSVKNDHGLTLLEDLGELNMGVPATLQYLIDYGNAHYPADRYILAMYDHGGGWQGACLDNTNNGWLSMNDIRTALSLSHGVDVLCFTAPCLMGAL